MTQTAPSVVQDDKDGLGRPLPVKRSRIQRFEGQPRRYFSAASIASLADDIQRDGQETPVKVCRHSTKSGTFVLIGGERRWRAFGLIAERTGTDPFVDCFIDTVHNEKHHFRKAFRDNIQREDLIPADEAATYQRLYDDSAAASHNAKVQEIAEMSGKSVTHVDNYLRLHLLDDSVKELMNPEREKRERLTVTAAIDIARSTKDPALQRSIAQEAIQRALGVVETRLLISLKTGQSGYGIGGRMRKPSDDYKAFKGFVGKTLNRARRIVRGLDLDALYATRDDEHGDREYDVGQLDELISHLRAMRRAISQKDDP